MNAVSIQAFIQADGQNSGANKSLIDNYINVLSITNAPPMTLQLTPIITPAAESE